MYRVSLKELIVGMININKIKRVVFLIIIVAGCSQKAKDTSPEVKQSHDASNNIQLSGNTQNMNNSEAIKWQQATVKYIKLEGGFYGLITHDGRKYLPIGLPKEYRQDDAIVSFKGRININVMTIQQWGTPFEITDIKLIKAGRKKVRMNN